MKHGLIAAVTFLALSTNVMADDSVNHSGQASKHSVLAAAGSIETGASVASAVSVAPVVLSVGALVAVHESAKAAHGSMEPKPIKLEITQKVITADPAPAAVMHQTVVNQTIINQGDHE